MDRTNILTQLLNSTIAEIPLGGFVLNLLLAAILGSFLAWYYIRYGHSASNRKIFARNFLPLTIITVLIIAIIKSSLALSLGLVGALSIVRFRAAIKDPEELTYLFASIAVGLGLGADQRSITIIALLMLLVILRLRDFWTNKKRVEPNLYLNVSLKRDGKIDLKDIMSVLEKNCAELNLKRFDETAENLEASFLVKYENIEKLNQAKSELREIAPSMEINLIDNE